MKIKKGFMLRDLVGEHIVVSVGDAIKDFNGVMKLNNAGAFLWGLLKEGAGSEALADALVSEYDISPETAGADATAFLQTLKDVGCLEE